MKPFRRSFIRKSISTYGVASHYHTGSYILPNDLLNSYTISRRLLPLLRIINSALSNAKRRFI